MRRNKPMRILSLLNNPPTSPPSKRSSLSLGSWMNVTMTTFYRNGRKYGRRWPRPVPPWLRPPSRPPDPSSTPPPDPHRNDIENTARYKSFCEFNSQGYFIIENITPCRARKVAGRCVKFMNDDLYDNLQTDR